MMDFILRFSITLYMVAKYTTVYSGRRLCKKGEHYCFGQLTNDSGPTDAVVLLEHCIKE